MTGMTVVVLLLALLIGLLGDEIARLQGECDSLDRRLGLSLAREAQRRGAALINKENADG